MVMNSEGALTALTASQKRSTATKINPRVEITLGRLKRVARVGAEASAATGSGDFTASSPKVLSGTWGNPWFPHEPPPSSQFTEALSARLPAGQAGLRRQLFGAEKRATIC